MQVKAGEFYTPQQVSKILAKIVTTNKPNLKMFMTLHVVQVHYYYVLVVKPMSASITVKNITILHST